MKPTWYYENKLRENGYEIVAGIDEAGRGCLAGPVVVGVVIAEKEKKKSFLYSLGSKLKVRDSKLLSFNQRKEIFKIITENFSWAVGVVSNQLIDKNGINWAVTRALKKALEELDSLPNFLLLDYGINLPAENNIPCQSFIKGDNRIFSCACASIVAKVWRDQLMIQYAKKFSHYGFENHKGYGTKEHYQLIGQYGCCQIHRQSFNLKALNNRPKVVLKPNGLKDLFSTPSS